MVLNAGSAKFETVWVRTKPGLCLLIIPNTFTRKEQTTLNRLLIGHAHLTQLSY